MIPQLISTSVSRVRHLATGTARGGVGLVLTVVGKVLPGGDSPRPTAYAPPSGARPSLRDDISPPAPEVDATPVTQPPAPEPTPTPGATTTMADPAPATTTPAVARTAKRATARQAPATKQAPVKKSAAAKATSTKSPATKTVATKAPAKKAAATKAPATKAPAKKAPTTKTAATKAPAAALDEPVSPVVDDPIVHSSGPDVAETVRADELKQLQPED